MLLLTVLDTGVYAQTDTLTVIFITDTHSHLVPYWPKNKNGKGTKGGIARVATVVKQLMASKKNPLFVHSGDLFVNDVMFNKFFGVPEFKMLIDLGLRVMCGQSRIWSNTRASESYFDWGGSYNFRPGNDHCRCWYEGTQISLKIYTEKTI